MYVHLSRRPKQKKMETACCHTNTGATIQIAPIAARRGGMLIKTAKIYRASWMTAQKRSGRNGSTETPSRGRQPMNEIMQRQDGGLEFFESAVRTFDGVQKIAELMAQMGTMPKHLQGNPADCFRVVVQAAKWRMDPFAVGECTSLVHGKMCFEGKLVHAVLISMGGIRGTLRFEFSGQERSDKRGVTVIGTLHDGTEARISGTVADWKTTGNGSPWSPGSYDRQLCYRGTREFARIYAPHSLLGVHTPDEAAEIREAQAEVVESRASLAEQIRSEMREPAEQKKYEAPAAEDWSEEITAEDDAPQDDAPHGVSAQSIVESIGRLYQHGGSVAIDGEIAGGKRLCTEIMSAWKLPKGTGLMPALQQLDDEDLCRLDEAIADAIESLNGGAE